MNSEVDQRHERVQNMSSNLDDYKETLDSFNKWSDEAEGQLRGMKEALADLDGAEAIAPELQVKDFRICNFDGSDFEHSLLRAFNSTKSCKYSKFTIFDLHIFNLYYFIISGFHNSLYLKAHSH